jgi:hypothetical protein
VGRELPVSVTLQSIISKAFPQEYANRAAEAAAAAAEAAAADSSSSRVTLPLFVMSTLVPGEKMALNIFEPRWVCHTKVVCLCVCVCLGGGDDAGLEGGAQSCA